MLVNYIQSESGNLSKVNEAFNQLDKDHTGYIEVDHLMEILPEFGEQLGQDNGLRLEYTDFLTRAIDIKEISKESLYEVFKHFDP